MNKKFSTLLLGALLAGAFTANAERVTTQEQFEALINERGVLELPEGDLKLVFAKGEYSIPATPFSYDKKEFLTIKTPNVKISGEEGAVLKGRMVLNAENISVSGLTIVNGETTAIEYSLFFHKAAISVLADKVTITDNVFRSEEDNLSTYYLAQGIELLPKNSDVTYVIEGNTFEGIET